MLVVGIEVVRRYLLSYSSLWGGETATYMFVYLSWVGMSWAAYKRNHIRISLLYQLSSTKQKTWLYLLSDVCMLLFGYFSILYTIPLLQNTLNYGRTMSGLPFNFIFFQIAIPLGMGLFLIRVAQRTYHDIRALQGDEPLYEGEQIFQMEGSE
jgi:TRAP-type C4-dicarboxylate transport system permease small subunit